MKKPRKLRTGKNTLFARVMNSKRDAAHPKCSICEKALIYKCGHNALPINDGRCCSDCNNMFVIPARIMRLSEDRPFPFNDDGTLKIDKEEVS